MDKEYIIQKLKDSKDILSTQFGLESIGLFGSVAKGTALANSDVDLVYIARDGVKIGYGQKIQLEEYLKELLSVTKLDLVNYKYLNPIIKHDIAPDIIYV